ncbi:MAG: hypothetical protein AB7N71_12355, partial [Phycisphaerae bacterium]
MNSVTQQREFEWAGLPHGWVVFVVLALAAGVAYFVFSLYRAETRAGASVTLRRFLSALRCVILAALALILLEPVIATYRQRVEVGRVLVMYDVSGSMKIRDKSATASTDQAGATRLAAVTEQLVGADAKFLKDLRARNQVMLYSFGASARRKPIFQDGTDVSSGIAMEAALV